MRVFVTGASGFIGRAVVGELTAAGHQVTGLARSEKSASVLTELGVTAHRGDLDDLEDLRQAAADSDGVIHLANKHDWNTPGVSDRAERAAVEAIGETLTGSHRPFLFASGTALANRADLRRPATEQDASPAVGADSMRGGAENLALSYTDKGVDVVPLRFAPSVHGEGDLGFVSIVAQAARRSGVSVYAGDGDNRWPAVHRSDAARLVRLGLESAPAGLPLHVAAEEAVPVRDIAEALAVRLDVPAKSVPARQIADEIPFIGGFVGADLPASSAITRERLGWNPTGPTLLDDIHAGHYDQP